MSSKTEIPFCSCNKGTLNINQQTSKLYMTDVNKEGWCDYCGYIVVWKSTYKIYPKSNGIGGYIPISTSPQKWRATEGVDAIKYREYFQEGIETNRYEYSEVPKNGRKKK